MNAILDDPFKLQEEVSPSRLYKVNNNFLKFNETTIFFYLIKR